LATINSNFVRTTATLGGSPAPVVVAVSASASATAKTLGGALIDNFTVNLATAGYPKNGAFVLALAVSTPVTVDLTATGTGTSASAGDSTFATVKELIFANYGTQDVIVSPGASNPFAGPLAGTAPTFTVPAGAQLRWQSPAGWTVDATHKTLKFDPGAALATIAVAIGGA
jgi:hypothetical protein